MLLSALVMTSSCQKKAEPPPLLPAIAETTAEAQPSTPPPPFPNAVPEPPTASEAFPETSKKQDYAADLRRLTKAVKDFQSKQGKLPRNFDEIKAAGLLADIPEPPPGKRWDIDPRKAEAIVAEYAVGL